MIKIFKKINKGFLLILILSLGLNFFYFFKAIFNSDKINLENKKLYFKTKVIKVIDGDTFDIENSERIRLYEINAPEYPKGCLGIDAKARLENLLLNKNINYEKIGKDNFGRILAYAYIDKLLINEVMTEEGLAYYQKGKKLTEKSLIIEKAQEKAKSTERGVWSSFCQTKKENCFIKGNFRIADHTRIYHTPDCYNYDRITIKPGTSDRWFCTEEEARAAGFRKSQDCPN